MLCKGPKRNLIVYILIIQVSTDMSQSTARVVLTGSTGGLGSSVLKHIVKFIDSSNIIVSLYNPSKLPSEISSLGVEVRHGDYSQPASLDTAFSGADILLIVSYPSIAHELRVRNHVNAIDAAKRVGVKHIFYTSLAFAGPPTSSESVAAVMRAHIDTEAYLKKSGVTYTIIREGIYSESYSLYLGFFNPSSENNIIAIPEEGNGGIAWASRDELGEGTAKLISEAAKGDTAYFNKSVLLSGPEVLSLSQVAVIISEILNRDIVVTYIKPEEYASSSAALTKLGPEFAKLWATTYEALKRGECSVIDSLLGQVLGRRPSDMETVLARLLKDTQSAQRSIEQYAK